MEHRPDGFDAIRGAHVLLVEDNAINQQVATELLKDEGFFVDVADNGKIAVEMNAEKGQPAYDVVLMDLQMPVMDGYTAAKEIRKETRFDDLPIVAMTADAMSGVREKVLDIGMNDYVTKPIDPSELFRVLREQIVPGDRELPDYFNDSQNVSENELPQLEGIDTEEGLARIGGNVKRYKKLLIKFIDNHGEAAKEIAEAISNKEMELAVRRAHTLKGVSGTIGAKELYEQAKSVESLLGSKRTGELSSALDKMTACLDRTLKTLSYVSDAQSTESNLEKKEVKIETLMPYLEKLHKCLEDWDIEAQTVLEEIHPIVKGTNLEHSFNIIGNHVAAYANDDAIAELENISKQLK
jgi:polar amino acid transport system substrate-binding protein